MKTKELSVTYVRSVVTCRGKGDECDKQGPAVRFLGADIILLFLTQVVKIIEFICPIIFTQVLDI